VAEIGSTQRSRRLVPDHAPLADRGFAVRF
jgi:hypothetical protein